MFQKVAHYSGGGSVQNCAPPACSFINIRCHVRVSKIPYFVHPVKLFASSTRCRFVSVFMPPCQWDCSAYTLELLRRHIFKFAACHGYLSIGSFARHHSIPYIWGRSCSRRLHTPNTPHSTHHSQFTRRRARAHTRRIPPTKHNIKFIYDWLRVKALRVMFAISKVVIVLAYILFAVHVLSARTRASHVSDAEHKQFTTESMRWNGCASCVRVDGGWGEGVVGGLK